MGKMSGIPPNAGPAFYCDVICVLCQEGRKNGLNTETIAAVLGAVLGYIIFHADDERDKDAKEAALMQLMDTVWENAQTSIGNQHMQQKGTARGYIHDAGNA